MNNLGGDDVVFVDGHVIVVTISQDRLIGIGGCSSLSFEWCRKILICEKYQRKKHQIYVTKRSPRECFFTP